MVNEKTGMEHPSVDYNYPVLVLASFAKNQYICLKIEADALQVRKVEQVMSRLAPPYRNRWILIFRSFAAGRV